LFFFANPRSLHMAKKIPSKLKSMMLNQEENRKDLGFGTKITGDKSRLVNKDGTFNVRRVGHSFLNSINWYHRLITIGWLNFFGIVFLFYFLLNMIFASLYLIVGTEYLSGIQDEHQQAPFWEAFFFSAQTLTTVGYGRISPVGFWTNSIAALEALVGLLLIALATGLLYGRFSRSVPRIRFSKHMILAPYLDINGLMFRIIHERDSELIDIEVDLSLSCLETLPSGAKTRKYYSLELERSHLNFFPMSWTVVHPITEDSPLKSATQKTLKETDAEFLIMIRAIDETFMQQVHVRYSYNYEEMIWGARFQPIFDSAARGNISLRIEDIDKFHPASLNS
jgi:inward rectifier potassium channel